MKLFLRIMVLSAIALPALAAKAESFQSSTVKGYFAALDRQDFDTALKLTSGSAQVRTAKMVGDLKEEAAKHNAKVLVEVKKVEVVELDEEGDGPKTIEVTFDIDIVGKKWMFKKVARRLNGTARFEVVQDPEPHIVTIDGKLVD